MQIKDRHVALGIILFGVVFTAIGAHIIYSAQTAARWPTTMGTARPIDPPHCFTTYNDYIEYVVHYAQAGKQYEGTYCDWYWEIESGTVTIHVNPADPTEFKPAGDVDLSNPFKWAFLAFGLLMTIIGISLWQGWLKPATEEQMQKSAIVRALRKFSDE